MTSRRPDQVPPERTFWELLPRRNFRRVLFLVLVLVAVVVLKRSGGLGLQSVLDALAPPPPAKRPAPAAADHGAFQRLRVMPVSAEPSAGGRP